MLENLKRHLYEENETSSALEAAAERLADDDEDIEDAFLDAEADPDAVVVGAENDPEIAKLVDEIPADDDDVTTTDVEKAIEAFVPIDDLEPEKETEPVDEGDLIDLDDDSFMDKIDGVEESFIEDDFSDLGISMESEVFDPTFEEVEFDVDDEETVDDIEDEEIEAVNEDDLIEPDFIEDFID